MHSICRVNGKAHVVTTVMIVTLKQCFIYMVGQNSKDKLSGIVQGTKIFLFVEFMSENVFV